MSDAHTPINTVPAPVAVSVVDDVDALRAAIFESNDLSSRMVHIKEWGVELEVRAMTGDERATYLATLQEHAPGGDTTKIDWRTFYPALLTATVYSPARDHTGQALPGESTVKVFRPEDVDQLLKKSSAAIERLAKAARELSGMGDDDNEDT